MARSVFFSFHYEDVASFRANVVRNSWRLSNADFSDGSIWEEAQRKGVKDLKRLIEDTGLYKTSVTAVLIGTGTYKRRWVKYEIVKSFEKGNGILGIHINRIRDKTKCICAKGKNPFERLGFQFTNDGRKVQFLELNERKWSIYKDLPLINNKKTNSIYFRPLNMLEELLGDGKFDQFYRFSDFFNTYCWVGDDGVNNLGDWVEDAYIYRGKEY